jgi:hypothetical protein
MRAAGMTRKLMSMCTFGAIDFRSDKERAAAYGKATKKQAKIMKEQRKAMR